MEGMVVTALGLESTKMKHELFAFEKCRCQNRNKAIL